MEIRPDDVLDVSVILQKFLKVAEEDGLSREELMLVNLICAASVFLKSTKEEPDFFDFISITTNCYALAEEWMKDI